MPASREFGAPAKREVEPGERFQMGIRVTRQLKHRLEEAAEVGGRSQSQEAEMRLQSSFDRQDLLPDVLTLAFGGSKEIAELLTMVGGAFLVAGEAVASTGRMREHLKGRHWILEPAVCEIALEAAHTVLEAYRPAGEFPSLSPGLGVDVANYLLGRKRTVSPETLGERLQTIADRLTKARQASKKDAFAADVVELVKVRQQRAAQWKPTG
jgi:predicted transcriptional regulator